MKMETYTQGGRSNCAQADVYAQTMPKLYSRIRRHSPDEFNYRVRQVNKHHLGDNGRFTKMLCI